MPAHLLTDVKIRKAKHLDVVYKLSDGKGLYLYVMPSGSKLWRYRYKMAGKENLYAMGDYPDVSVTEARDRLGEAKKLVKQGLHPAHQKQACKNQNITDNANTFGAVWETFSTTWPGARPQKWSENYREELKRSIKKDVLGEFKRRPMRSISAHDIASLIEKIAERGAVTVAINMRGYLKHIFVYAKSKHLVDSNPAAEVRPSDFISKPKAIHHAQLAFEQIPDFLKKLGVYRGEPTTRIALHLLLLTFVRKGELIAARWPEFELDSEDPIWVVPAERMKMREKHKVPLSTQAVTLLRELWKLTGGREHIFPNRKRPNAAMSDRTLNAAIDNLGYGAVFVPHGLRSTASTKLNELGYRPDIIERQLAHQDRNVVRRAYNDAEYLEERRAMMQQWAEMIDSAETGRKQVIPIRKKVAA